MATPTAARGPPVPAQLDGEDGKRLAIDHGGLGVGVCLGRPPGLEVGPGHAQGVGKGHQPLEGRFQQQRHYFKNNGKGKSLSNDEKAASSLPPPLSLIAAPGANDSHHSIITE